MVYNNAWNMGKNRITATVGVFFVSACWALAGNGRQWTLKDCIDYALEHNITVTEGRLAVRSSSEDISEAKAKLYPSLSFSTTHQGGYRPFADGSGDYMDNVSYAGDYGLNANWTVWNGNANRNTLKQQKIVGKQQELALEESVNSIQEQILNLYVQLLYVGEAVKVDEQILEISRQNAIRGAEMYEVGSLSKADLSQLDAQVATDEYNLVNMKGLLEDYKQQLKYLLRLDYDADFDIAVPSSSDEQALAQIPSVHDVLANAMVSRPEIRGAMLGIEHGNVGIDIAKAGRMPTISLTGGIGTSTISGTHTQMGVSSTWGNQMKSNINGSIGVTLSVPIFDNRAAKTAITKAEISLQQSKAEADDAKSNLALTVQGFWINATTNQQRFRAAVASVASAQDSYDLLSEQFRLGLKNIVELTNAKTTLLNAQQNRLESKYMAILYLQLLYFYKGEEMKMI